MSKTADFLFWIHFGYIWKPIPSYQVYWKEDEAVYKMQQLQKQQLQIKML